MITSGDLYRFAAMVLIRDFHPDRFRIISSPWVIDWVRIPRSIAIITSA